MKKTLFICIMFFSIFQKSLMASDDNLTGTWKGMLYEKSIEMAVWPNRRDAGSTSTQWTAYLYMQHYDCFMIGNISNNVNETYIDFTSLEANRRLNNCKKNIKNRKFKFRGSGTFHLKGLPNEFISELDYLYIGFNRLTDKNKIKVMSLKRGAVSNQMIRFINEYKHNYALKPTVNDFSIFKVNEELQTSGSVASETVLEDANKKFAKIKQAALDRQTLFLEGAKKSNAKIEQVLLDYQTRLLESLNKSNATIEQTTPDWQTLLMEKQKQAIANFDLAKISRTEAMINLLKKEDKQALVKTDKITISELTQDLRDRRKKVSSSQSLAKIGEQTIPELIQDLGNRRKKIAASQALVKIGKPAIPALINASKEESKQVFASIALATIRKAEIPELIQDLGDRRKSVSASQSLAKIGKQAIPELIQVLDDKKKRVAASQILVKIGKPAVPELIQILGDKKKGVAASQVLAKIGKLAVPELIQVLGDRRKKISASQVLVKVGKPAIPALIQVLEDKKKGVAASQILVNIGKPAIPALTNALKEKNKQDVVRLALTKISETVMLELIQDLEDKKKRVAASQALVDIGKPAIPELIQVLEDKKKGVAASLVLAKIGETVIPELIQDLGDRRKKISASQVLVKVGKPAIPALIQVLGDKKKGVAASQILVSIGKPAIPELIQVLGDKDKGVAVSLVLVDIGKAAVPALTNALKEKSKQNAARFTLAKMGNPAIPNKLGDNLTLGKSHNINKPMQAQPLKDLKDELKEYTSEMKKLKNIESINMQSHKYTMKELQKNNYELRESRSELQRLSKYGASRYGTSEQKYLKKISNLEDLVQSNLDDYNNQIIKIKIDSKMIKTLAIKISKIEKKFHTAESSNLPLSLRRHYLVDAIGEIKQISSGGDALGKRLDVRSLDSGTYRGLFSGWAEYSSSTGKFFREPVIMKVPGTWYCNVGLKGMPYTSHLKPIELSDGSYMDNVWKVIPDNPNGVCVIENFSREGCKAVECLKYMNDISYITSDKITAQKIAVDLQKGAASRRADIQAEMDKINSIKNNSTGNPGYFDRGGACGSLSCEETDNILINQHIINNF